MPTPNIDEILERLKALENELTKTWDQILQEKRELFHYTLKEGKVQFEKGIRALQKREKTGLLKYLFAAHCDGEVKDLDKLADAVEKLCESK